MSVSDRQWAGMRIDNGDFEIGDLILLQDGSGRAFIARAAHSERNLFEVYRPTLSQCTGKTDLKKYYIFENDIVEDNEGNRSVVKYCEGEAKFVLERKYVVTELGNKQVTVIGNIFEDPHLIPDD